MCALVTGVQTCALPIYGLAGRDEFDVVADFSAPLPTQVILTLFGLPLSDAARITEWSEDLAAFVGGAKLIPDKYERATRRLTALRAYLRAAVAAARPAGRRPHPAPARRGPPA